MPTVKPKGNGRVLGFKGIITEAERLFLKRLCTVDKIIRVEIKELLRIKKKVELNGNRNKHILSVIDMLERVFFDD